MRSLLAQELHKLRTTPAAWVSLGVTLVLGIASVVTNVLVPVQAGAPAFGSAAHVNKTLSVAALSSMVMLAVGILVVAGEYRHRTVLQTYLGEPRRGRVLLAKMAMVSGLGAVAGAVVFGLAYGVAVVLYASKGVGSLGVEVAAPWLGAALSTAVFGVLGVALGALTRNTVAAVVGAVGWVLVVEAGILQSVLPELARWLPAGAGAAITLVGDAGGTLLSPATGALVLIGWAALVAGAAARFSLTREAL